MADMFLKLDGVTGESTDTTHAGEIEIYSFSWGVSNAANVTSGTTGAGAAGRASFSDFSISKRVDNASSTLMKYLVQGHHFPTAKLTVRKPGGTAVEFYTIDFTEVYTTSYQISGSDGGGDPMESVSFAFTSIKPAYTQQSDTGSTGTVTEFGWSVKTNAEQA